MKLSWGYKIMLAYLSFVGLIGFLVYKCTQTKFDLVSNEYYKEELAYQQVIDGKANANALSKPVSIQTTDNTIQIRFPEEVAKASIKGVALFYCITDGRRDRKINLDAAGGVMELDAGKFYPGNYIVKISWQAGEQHYYSEQRISL